MQQQNTALVLDSGNGVVLLQEKNRVAHIEAPTTSAQAIEAVGKILAVLSQLGVMHLAAKPAIATPTQNPADVVQWPAWRYGPDGQAAIFDAEEQVPEGWVEHASLLPSEEPSTEATANDDVFENLSDEALRKLLDEAKISYQPKWPRDKLISLLKAAGA